MATDSNAATAVVWPDAATGRYHCKAAVVESMALWAHGDKAHDVFASRQFDDEKATRVQAGLSVRTAAVDDLCSDYAGRRADVGSEARLVRSCRATMFPGCRAEESGTDPKIQFSMNKTPENPVSNENGVRDVMRANPLSSCFDSMRRSGIE